MKKVKIALFLIVAGFLGLAIYQNLPYFQTQQSLVLNLKFWSREFPPIANGLYFVGCFALGFLIMFFMSLVSRFRANKMIKALKAENVSHLQAIAALRDELNQTAVPAAPGEVVAEMPEEQPEMAPELSEEAKAPSPA